MSAILIITNDNLRGEIVSQSILFLWPCAIVDITRACGRILHARAEMPCAVVSNISFKNPHEILALQNFLTVNQLKKLPHVCLVNEETPLVLTQAKALGATTVLHAREVSDKLIKTLVTQLVPDAGQPGTVKMDVHTTAVAMKRIFDLGRRNEAFELDLVSGVADMLETALRRSHVRTWLENIWLFDDITYQHCLLVAATATAFSQHLGFGRSDCLCIAQAALLHDIGKSRIPIGILHKASQLDADEWRIVQRHPLIGYDLLAGSNYPTELLDAVRSHHEYLDGSGYPDGLSHSQISDVVRIITICDIYSALIEHRTYRAPMCGERAYDILRSMDGKLDQDLVRAFRPIAAESKAILEVA